MKPIVEFRIRPERGSRLALGVEIYRTTTEFRAAVRAENKQCGFARSRTRGLVGQCIGLSIFRHRRGKPDRRMPLFAIVRFPQRHLTMSTITHEAFHATCRWAERRRILAIPTGGDHASNIVGPRTVASIEERAAIIHDNICRRLVVELQRRKLLPPS